jgi:hypothetical protein
MDIATGTWFKFLREDTEKHEPEEVITELVQHKSDKIEKWVKRQGGLEYVNNEIDDMFGGPGKMRLAFPMGGEDARNLGEIVRVLRTHGWKPAKPMPEEGWNAFETHDVKQKEQRRVGELSDYPDFVPPPNPTTNPDPRPVEDVYRDKTVAKLDLRRTFPITIPAGPRKGETIEKTVKKSMSKAIAELVKRGDLSPNLLEWWDKKQIYYTNDEQWIGVQELFDGQEEEPYDIIVSRHPKDVLRMSDVEMDEDTKRRIRSCHRMGGSHEECAWAEAHGVGVVAYRVKSKDLDAFLRGTTGSYLEKAQNMVRRHILNNRPKFETLHKTLNDAHMFEWGVDAIKRGWYQVPETVKDLITYDMVRDAVRAELDKKPWPNAEDIEKADEPRPLSDWDRTGPEGEIFRDSNREIPGLVAAQRVRLRKFYDSASDDWFMVPEQQTYGDKKSGFAKVVRSWAWDNQKDLFVDELAGDELQIPREEDLQRHGSTWEDTKDGELLNKFFSMSGERIREYDEDDNVEAEVEDEMAILLEQLESQVADLLRAAANRSEHASFWAEVTQPEWGEDQRPIVEAHASVHLKFPVLWEGSAKLARQQPRGEDEVQAKMGHHQAGFYRFTDEKRQYVPLPHPHYGNYEDQSELKKTINKALGWDSPEEMEINVDFEGHRPKRLILSVIMQYRCDDCAEQDEPGNNLDSFIDHMISEVDSDYDKWYEKIRRALVEDRYIPASDFDQLADDMRELAEDLTNWQMIGGDEEDFEREVWFNFKNPLQGTADQPADLWWIGSSVDFPESLGHPGDTPFALVKLINQRGPLNPEEPSHPFRDAETIAKVTPAGTIEPGEEFTQKVAHKLTKLQELANGYAKDQLELEYGEKYGRPDFEGVDFGKAAEIKLMLPSTAATDKPYGIMFTLKLHVHTNDEREELEGLFEFVKYIDQYPDMFIKAVRETLVDYVGRAGRFAAKRDKDYLDGTRMQRLVGSIERQGFAVDGGRQVIDWIQDNWGIFNKVEKYVAIDNFLRPLNVGSLSPAGAFSNPSKMPMHWNSMVRSKLREMGRSDQGSETSRNRYEWQKRWQDLSDPHAGRTVTGERSQLSPEQHDRAITLGMRYRAYMREGDDEPYAQPMRPADWSDEDWELVQHEIPYLRRLGADEPFHSSEDEEEPVPPPEPGTLDADPRDAAAIRKAARGGDRPMEEEILRIDKVLNERFDLRLYKMQIQLIIRKLEGREIDDLKNTIRGIKHVTTVKTISKRNVAEAQRVVFELKYEQKGIVPREDFIRFDLLPMLKKMPGIEVEDWSRPEIFERGALKEYFNPNTYASSMVTPKASLEQISRDWVEGGVRIYDMPAHAQDMQYHLMMPVEELLPYISRIYRAPMDAFEGRYYHFIKKGAQAPVFLVIGQNGRIKISGNEDIVWFAKKAGLKEVPVFVRYQKQA